MPVFNYTAAERNGNLTQGEREAENERALADLLKKDGFLLLEVKGREKEKLNLLKDDLGRVFAGIKGVSLEDKMFFTRNLAVMIGAGLSLTKALDALSHQTPNPKFSRIIREIGSSISKGTSFTNSLEPHRKVFGDLFISMVEVGEATGKLVLVLKLSANQMKKDYELRKRVKGAMMYPAIIVSTLFIIGWAMMTYVVPSLVSTIKELGVILPVSTQILIFFSELLSTYATYALIVFLILIIAAWRVLLIKEVRGYIDRISLRLPIFGPLIIKFNLARFCRTLAYMIVSGVPIVRSLEVTSKVLGNSVYRSSLTAAAASVQKGRQLNEIFKEYPRIFQPVVVQMIQVGEESGKLSDMLLRLALFFEEEVDNTTKNLSTIIEPLLMILIGGVVAFFALSMFQPIYSSIGSI